MATTQNVRFVEERIGYVFVDKDTLRRALIAAGAEEENPDGNRKLANVGTSLVEFLTIYIGFEAGTTRGNTSNFRQCISSIAQRAKIAQKLGIDRCIKYGIKDGARNPSVQGKAVNAIVGATFVDSDDLTMTLKVILRLGLLDKDCDTINPHVLQMERIVECLTLGSVAKTFLDGVSNDISTFKPVIRVRQKVSNNHGQDAAIAESNICAVCQHNQVSGVVSFPSSAVDRTPPPVQAPNNTQSSGEPSQTLLSMEEIEALALLSTDMSRPSDTLIQQGIDTNQENILAQTESSADYSFEESLNTSAEVQTRGDLSEYSTTGAPNRSTAVGPRRKRRANVVDEAENTSSRAATQRRIQNNADCLEEYLSHEQNRCNQAGLPGPTETFFTAEVQQAIQNLKKSDTNYLETIAFGIASPESVVGLQKMLQNCRLGHSTGPERHKDSLTIADHYMAVENLDKMIAHHLLLRRYHVLKLFEKSGGADTASSTGMVFYTNETLTGSDRRLGNPRNLDEAAVTIRMMRGIFPWIKEGTEKSHPKYTAISKLRKLGHRLHLLVSRFGEGILGLIQQHSVTSEIDLGIADYMILWLDDHTFSKFLDIIDRSQGNNLRQFSSASSAMVDVLVHERVKESASFAIEMVDMHYIIGLPKGSELLLQSITGSLVQL